MPAVILAAAVTAGGTYLASKNSADAAKTAANDTSAASAANIAEQKREFDAIQAANAPYRDVGTSAIGAIGGAFGLPGYGAPTMTGPQVASTPVTNPGGVSMTNPGAITVPAGGTGKLGNGVSVDPASAGPAASQQADWTAYIANNPDIKAYADNLVSTGVIGPNGQFKTPEEFAQAQYANTGQAEGRQVPGVSMTAPASPTGYTPAPGYTDPTAPNGYTVGARPMTAPIPGAYVAPSLNVGLDQYQKSPDFQFRLDQGNKALSNVASSMGGVMSGARLKAADRYNQDFATTDYNNWRDYTTNQYNTSNNFGMTQAQQAIAQADQQQAVSNGLFQDDRTYDANRLDTRTGQLMTLAGFGTQANNANANAAQSFATNASNLSMTAANAQGNAAINGANAFTGGVNNLITTGAYLGGKLMTGNQPTYNGGYDELAGVY